MWSGSRALPAHRRGCGFLTWAAQPRLLAGSWDFLPSFPPQPRPHSSTSSFKQLLEGGKTDGKEAAPSIEFITRLLPGPRSLGTGPQFRPMAPASPRAGVGRHCLPGGAVSTDGLSPGSRSPPSLRREKPHPPTVAPRLPPCWSQSPWSSTADSFCHHTAHPSGRGSGGGGPRVGAAGLCTRGGLERRGPCPAVSPASSIPHSSSWSFVPFPSRAPEGLSIHTFRDGLARPLCQGTAPATQGLGRTTAPPPSAQQLTRSPAAPLEASSGAPGCGRRR